MIWKEHMLHDIATAGKRCFALLGFCIKPPPMPSSPSFLLTTTWNLRNPEFSKSCVKIERILKLKANYIQGKGQLLNKYLPNFNLVKNSS